MSEHSAKMIVVEAGATARRSLTKFSDPYWTAKGERRAVVPFKGLSTLWFNTGTLCNIACTGCYIESSPRNDALVYLSRAEVRAFLAEAGAAATPPGEIGFTGGEPFMNPDVIGMLDDSLTAGHRVLILTNGMRPMQRHQRELLDLNGRYPGRLTIRVSLDHYERQRHEYLRGESTWRPALDGLVWLAAHGFNLAIAGRRCGQESEASLRAGYGRCLARHGVTIDCSNPARLVLFPDMDRAADVPEITESCWDILKKSPDDVMCATSRMVVKRKGAAMPAVLSCTLLAYDPQFELGNTLADSARPVRLNHVHCAKFCVLGGASCSVANER